jgi:hypothetical protein
MSEGRKDLESHPQLGTRLQKKKGKKNNSLSKTQDTEAKPNNMNLQVDEDFLASLNSSTARTSIASSVKVDVRIEGDGQEEECIGEALQNIKHVDTLSPLKIQ